jgi:hypothetical protein
MVSAGVASSGGPLGHTARLYFDERPVRMVAIERVSPQQCDRITPGDPAKARALLAPLADAGAKWWDERLPLAGEDFHRLAPALGRVDQGPPGQ